LIDSSSSVAYSKLV